MVRASPVPNIRKYHYYSTNMYVKQIEPAISNKNNPIVTWLIRGGSVLKRINIKRSGYRTWCARETGCYAETGMGGWATITKT